MKNNLLYYYQIKRFIDDIIKYDNVATDTVWACLPKNLGLDYHTIGKITFFIKKVFKKHYNYLTYKIIVRDNLVYLCINRWW